MVNSLRAHILTMENDLRTFRTMILGTFDIMIVDSLRTLKVAIFQEMQIRTEINF